MHINTPRTGQMAAKMVVVYVCLENSSFTGKAGDVFQIIESDIARYSQIGKCLIFGDFNGRTSIESDFCSEDENLTKFIPIDGSELIDVNIPRNYCDTSPVDKQQVLMHGHQGWNVRHGLCHIYMRYVYIYELFIAFTCFVVCSLL